MAGTVQVTNYTRLEDVPQGSVGVVDFEGPVLKYDTCGSMGTMSFAEHLTRVGNHPNIKAIVVRADTPGGQVYGTDTLSDAVAACPVPVLLFVNDGMLASAGVWAFVPADEIYCSRATDQVGSIGVYQGLVDDTEEQAKTGRKRIQVYATKSTEKNGPYREFAQGNEGPLKAELDFIRDRFEATVRHYRPQVKDEAFYGAMYFAEEAQEMGLIDGIKSFEEVIKRAQELGGETTSSTQSSTNKRQMFSPFKKVAALAGIAAGEVTEAQLAAANAELSAKGIVGASLVEAGLIESMESELTHSEAELEKAQEKAAESAEEIRTLKADLATANTKIAELQKGPAGKTKGSLIQEDADKIQGKQQERPLSSWARKAQERAALTSRREAKTDNQ
ncbi:S49 family peptidase [Rufibacter immobilis]|nr:S49 family peptidase [Rufibacter immobilis]